LYKNFLTTINNISDPLLRKIIVLMSQILLNFDKRYNKSLNSPKN